MIWKLYGQRLVYVIFIIEDLYSDNLRISFYLRKIAISMIILGFFANR